MSIEKQAMIVTAVLASLVLGVIAFGVLFPNVFNLLCGLAALILIPAAFILVLYEWMREHLYTLEEMALRIELEEDENSS